MPSNRLRRGLWFSEASRTWHYHFKRRGLPLKGDTGCPSRALAEKWLVAYKARLAGAEVGLVDAGAIPTLRQAWVLWQSAKTGRAGASWRETVERALHMHMAELLDLPLSALTTPVVEARLTAYLAQPGHSVGGANVVLRALSSVANLGCRRTHILRPYELPPFPVQEKPKAPLTAKRIGALLRKLESLGARHQVLDVVRLMAALGLRVSEAGRARVEAVDLKRWTLTPWDPKAGTKGKEAVALPIPTWIRPRIAELVGDRQEGYLIRGARGEFPGRDLVSKWLVKARESLGWPWLTPHTLRGAYATLLSEEGVPPQTIQQLLRHKSFNTTRRYLRSDHGRALAAANRIGEAAGL